MITRDKEINLVRIIWAILTICVIALCLPAWIYPDMFHKGFHFLAILSILCNSIAVFVLPLAIVLFLSEAFSSINKFFKSKLKRDDWWVFKFSSPAIPKAKVKK